MVETRVRDVRYVEGEAETEGERRERGRWW
jgi:hypothetical protein